MDVYCPSTGFLDFIPIHRGRSTPQIGAIRRLFVPIVVGQAVAQGQPSCGPVGSHNAPIFNIYTVYIYIYMHVLCCNVDTLNMYIYYCFLWPLSVFGGHVYSGSIYKIPGSIYKIPGAIYCSISGTIYNIPGAIYCSISGTMYKIPGTIDRLGRKYFQNPRNCL